VAIAFEAGQREIIADRLTAVFERDEMVNVMGEWNIVLMEQTILTASFRPFNDEPPKRVRYVYPAHDRLIEGRECRTGARLEQKQNKVYLFVHIKFGGFIISQAILAVLV